MDKQVLIFFLKAKDFYKKNVNSIISGRNTPLFGRKISLSSHDGECVSVVFNRDEMMVKEEQAEHAAAYITMSDEDWAEVISGKVAIMSVVVAGRCPYPKDQRLGIAKASIAIQSIATMLEAGE